MPWKVLWSMLWRTLAFGPVLFILGLTLLTLTLALVILPPIYAAVFFMSSDVFYGLFLLSGWILFLHWMRPRWGKLLAGMEHASL